MPVVVAIDAGTTGVRAVAVDERGQIAGWSYRELSQHYPRPGWVEHDPAEIWTAVGTTMTELAAELDGRATAVSAVGITDQRETTVVWDRRTGEALAPAIVWQDRRTAPACEALVDAGHLPMIRKSTGLVLDPYFSATKLAWLLTDGGVRPGPHLAFGTIDAWLIAKLTAGSVHATDPGNASRTMLYDIGRLAWSEELCDLFGVPPSCLPEVRPSSGTFGVIASTAVPALAGVPIAGVAGDQQAALFGQACVDVAMTKVTFGTGTFVLMNVGAQLPEPADGLLTTVAWTLGDETTAYALEGSVFVTGAAISWLRDLGIISTAAEVGPLAASVPDAGGVFIVPAFTGLGSPWWDPYARGTVLGLARGAGRAQLARAVVESMAFLTQDVVDAMTVASGSAITAMRADGGAAVMDLLLQSVADQTQATVARPTEKETTALGAAYLAGLGVGVWGSLEEIRSLWRVDREFAPSITRGAAATRQGGWRRAVGRATDWARPR